jgi:methionyl-tRNA synthetase
MREKYYITTPIYYVNDVPHIGHLYTSLVCDVLARFHRMHQDAVFFLTGTDEHGGKIVRAAEKAGMATQAYTDKIAASFSLLADTYEISNDDFIRTTDARHLPAPVALWERAAAAGKIYKKKYRGLYCVGCEAFKTDKELVEGKCPDHGISPEEYEEENYFFKLTDFKDQLLSFYKAHPDFVAPAPRLNEVLGMVNELEDVSISRSRKHLSWGIPVPGDDDQVMYVWFDALSNYLSAIGYPDDAYKKWWPADVHVIAKDILRFHAVLWPAMCMAAGIEPPRQVAVHGFLTVNGQKMSKTRGNVVDPFTLAEQFGVETIRYFLMRELPFSGDGDFSEARVHERYVGDLANGVGNLLARVLAMVEKYEGGKVPAAAKGDIMPSWRAYEAHMNEYAFHLALADVWDVIGSADKLVNDRQPWVLAKTDTAALSELLYVLCESLRHIALMLWPFMPETAEKMFVALGVEHSIGTTALSELQQWGVLKPGTQVSRGAPLFPRHTTKP